MSTINIISVSSPVWANADHTLIDCEITVEHYPGETLPFTADPNDTEEYGRQIYAAAVAGQFGPVAAFVPPPPPPPPSATANKAEAERRLQVTDWVNEPDVYDPTRNPHLTNRDAFLDYRAAVRAIAVYPIAGNIQWPVEVEASWSSPSER